MSQEDSMWYINTLWVNLLSNTKYMNVYVVYDSINGKWKAFWGLFKCLRDGYFLINIDTTIHCDQKLTMLNLHPLYIFSIHCFNLKSVLKYALICALCFRRSYFMIFHA